VVSPQPSRTHLPRSPQSLTFPAGWHREGAAVIALLRSTGVRLLTLTGPGGSGKTSLALHVGSELADEFFDGVQLVNPNSERASPWPAGSWARSSG
jgi:ATP/maltotriose-dependent transcriptional regulator MalT